jgi:hypothetical protein
MSPAARVRTATTSSDSPAAARNRQCMVALVVRRLTSTTSSSHSMAPRHGGRRRRRGRHEPSRGAWPHPCSRPGAGHWSLRAASCRTWGSARAVRLSPPDASDRRSWSVQMTLRGKQLHAALRAALGLFACHLRMHRTGVGDRACAGRHRSRASIWATKASTCLVQRPARRRGPAARRPARAPVAGPRPAQPPGKAAAPC